MIATATLHEQLELAEELRLGRATMNQPQDLPGRFGRVVRSVDKVLATMHGVAVVAGGWAVWHHGYLGRVTQDLDIAIAAEQVDEFLRVAALSGFEVFQVPPGRWPKLRHKETGIDVDLLPEGGRPGVPARLAPTTIPHPARLGGLAGGLCYISLPALLELKLAAARARDDNDVVELLRAHSAERIDLRKALSHPTYQQRFDALAQRADEES